MAQWCLDRKAPAGLGSDTLPALAQRLLPLTTANLTLGVLVIEPANLRLLMIPEQLRLLDLYGVLIAIALERIALARDAEQAQLKMESERLRNSLLAALSHDLRTPLTVLFGQAEILTLELGSAGLPQALQAEAIRQQVLDTSRLVNNLPGYGPSAVRRPGVTLGLAVVAGAGGQCLARAGGAVTRPSAATGASGRLAVALL